MIIWSFIASLEGRDVLTGYVPDPEGSRSGVTIASGVDLGHMGSREFLSLPKDVQDLVQPYLGLTGLRAQEALKAKPLKVTADQAKALDAVAEAAVLGPLVASYDSDTKGGEFARLPDRAQTVLTSVAYQYGNLAARCPKFWGCMIRKDWQGAISELHAFGDRYEGRHLEEAAYLRPLLSA